MQSTWPSYLDSRSQVKVKGCALEFRVCSISPEAFDRFPRYFTHMFLKIRLFAKHMTQLPRPMVTGQGLRIYPWISCPLHVSWTLDRFAWYFTHMYLLVRWCAEHITQQPRLKAKVIGQGQRIYLWISCLLHISWTLEAIFITLHLNIPLSEIMCRTYGLATQTQGQGYNSRSCDLSFNLCPLHIS